MLSGVYEFRFRVILSIVVLRAPDLGRKEYNQRRIKKEA